MNFDSPPPAPRVQKVVSDDHFGVSLTVLAVLIVGMAVARKIDATADGNDNDTLTGGSGADALIGGAG